MHATKRIANSKRISIQKLLAEAKKRNVTVEINRGRTSDDRGSIELLAPDGFQFEAELHALVNEQQNLDHSHALLDGPNRGQVPLEPWANVIESAFHDLMANPIQPCPEKCTCRE